MNMITLYDSDGFYTQSYDLPDGETPVPPVGGGYVSGDFDGEEYYHLGGVTTVRPVVTTEDTFNISSNGTDTVVIPLPSGTIVTDLETGDTYTSAGVESLTFKSSINGEWEIMIEPLFPYKPILITVNADAD